MSLCVVLLCGMSCGFVSRRVVSCRTMSCCNVICYGTLWRVISSHAVVWCIVSCWCMWDFVVSYCVVLRCAAFDRVVLCYDGALWVAVYCVVSWCVT